MRQGCLSLPRFSFRETLIKAGFEGDGLQCLREN
jgi:hypothetical protein